MGSYVIQLDEATDRTVEEIGGKAFGLARLMASDFPVPEGAIVVTGAFAEVVRGMHGPALRPDATDEELDARCRAAQARVLTLMLPPALEVEVVGAATALLSHSPHIVVRSSGTLEDTPGSSLSGQLDTYTNVATVEEALVAMRRCWASAFKPGVVRYLTRRGLDPRRLKVGVILQCQIDAERSGLAFSRDPVNRYAGGVIIEAIAGVGEDLVSGEATPERYRFGIETGSVTVTRLLGAGEGGSVELDAPDERRLGDVEVALLAGWAQDAESLFGCPQDMEWAFAEGRFWLLQSRPLVFAEREEHLFPQIAEHIALAHGAGVSPAVGAGAVVTLAADDPPPEPAAGLVVVLPRLTNDLAVRLRDAAGVVAEEGGATSHGANILREFEVPAVIGAGSGVRELEPGASVTVDGYRGVVYEGDLRLAPVELADVPQTRLKVFVSVLVPDRAAVLAPLADGVSSLRDDYFLLDAGVHPSRLIRDGQGEELEAAIARGILRCSELFGEKPVWYKTMDAPSDEFRRLAGGHDEPVERNPLLGWRGIGRELAERPMLDVELGAIARALEAGATNVGIKLPFLRSAAEYVAVESALLEHGLRPHKDILLGVSVEIPAVAMRLREFLELGADFVSIGLSDLTMCTLALDRESRHVAGLFDPAHPAVIELLGRIAEESRAFDTFTCVCGESARDERVLPLLVELGFDAVGVSLSYFGDVKRSVADLELDT